MERRFAIRSEKGWIRLVYYQGVLDGLFYINSVKTNASTMEPHGAIEPRPAPESEEEDRQVGGLWQCCLGRGIDSSTCPAPLTLATNSTPQKARTGRPCARLPGVQAWALALTCRFLGLLVPPYSTVYSLLFLINDKILFALTKLFLQYTFSFSTLFKESVVVSI